MSLASYHLTVTYNSKLLRGRKSSEISDLFQHWFVDPFLTLSRQLKYVPFEILLKMELLEMFVVCPFWLVLFVLWSQGSYLPWIKRISLKLVCCTSKLIRSLLFMKWGLIRSSELSCASHFFPGPRFSMLLHFVTVFLPGAVMSWHNVQGVLSQHSTLISHEEPGDWGHLRRK